MLAWGGVLIMGFRYLLSYPVPTEDKLKAAREAEESRPLMSDLVSPRLRDDELGAREIKLKWAESKPVYDQLLEQYKKIPKFRPPADGLLTEKQMLALHDIYMGGVIDVRNYQINNLGPSPKFFKAVASYAYLPVLVEVARVRGLVKHQMTDEEMTWVLHRVMEAALFACNRKWETGEGTEWEREELKKIRPALAGVLGLVENRKYEEGGTFTFPERLDTSKMRRANVALFLKLHTSVRWTGIRFYDMNFNDADILRAAASLPE